MGTSFLALFLTSVCLLNDFTDIHAQSQCPMLSLSGGRQTSEWDTPMTQEMRTESDLPGRCTVVSSKAFCSNGGWQSIPQNLPSNIIELDLRNNRIAAIRNRSLSKYPRLLRLDLSQNFISLLYPESFYGLSNLEYLNLLHNNLSYSKGTFPPDVFRPLKKSLIELVISKNNPDPDKKGLEYPGDELGVLTSLETLFMDGLKNPILTESFRNLTSLTVLSLSGYIYGYCGISGLDIDTFMHLSQVKCLYLITCSIKGDQIHPETFQHLHQLIHLDLAHNEGIGIEHLPNVSYGLRNTKTLYSLRLHLIVPRYNLGICISNQSLEYFPRYVKHLDAQENSIEYVARGAVTLLPKDMQVLDLSGNKLVFGRAVMTALSEMKNLQILKLNGRTFTYNIPINYPSFKPDSEALDWKVNCSNDWSHDNQNDTLFFMKLPPNLKTVEMRTAGLIYHLTELHVDKNNSLENLTLSGNRFSLLEGPFTGLHSLKHLDLSFCFTVEIKKTFFQNLTSLETLNLSSNYLADIFSKNDSQSIFAPLINLKELDLSFNLIGNFDQNVFKNLDKLTHLNLADNLITKLLIDISHMSNLIFLDLRRTHLAFLDRVTQKSIDKLIGNGVPIRIDMSKTPISCDCHNIHFLEWMVVSSAFDKKFENYKCDYYDLLVQDITDGYDEAMTLLRRKCSPHQYLLLVVALSVTLILFAIGVSICYRFRWNLRYLYHVAYLHYKKEKKTNNEDYEYDAFICYANEDHDFVVEVLEPELRRRGRNLYVHGRDFVAGEYISSNIVGAVCRSRKTLVVLTQNMLKSSWCNYEIQMANMEAVHTGRKVLVFLLKGSIPGSRDNLNIFYNIKINTYLEYPSPENADTDQMQAMWEKLSRDLLD